MFCVHVLQLAWREWMLPVTRDFLCLPLTDCTSPPMTIRLCYRTNITQLIAHIGWVEIQYNWYWSEQLHTERTQGEYCKPNHYLREVHDVIGIINHVHFCEMVSSLWGLEIKYSSCSLWSYWRASCSGDILGILPWRWNRAKTTIRWTCLPLKKSLFTHTAQLPHSVSVTNYPSLAAVR